MENRVMHSNNRNVLVANRIRSIRGTSSTFPGENMDYPFGRTPAGYEKSFVFHVAKALRKDKKLKPKLLTYFSYPQNSDYVVKWLLDVPSLEKLKKQLQEDDILLRQIQSFYGPYETEETKRMEGFIKYQEDYALIKSPQISRCLYEEYDKYLRMKKKASELERNLKEVLLRELDYFIQVGNQQAAALELKRRRRKSSPKPAEKQSAPPKTPLEFAVNYLQNEGSKIPFYKPNSRNTNIQKTSEAVAWVLANIIEVEQKNRNNVTAQLPEDLDPDYPFDQFIVDKVAGKALVGPMEKEVMPMFAYFVGPLLTNQLQELHELAVKLKAGNEPAVELIRKTAEKLPSRFTWKVNESETLLTAESRAGFDVAHEISLPDFAKVRKLIKKQGQIPEKEVAALEKLYNELNEYMLYLNGSIYSLQKTLFVKRDLLNEIADKVGMALVDKMAPEELQAALEAFRNAWNHYYFVYDPSASVSKQEDLKGKIAKARNVLANIKDNPLADFITSALDYPEIVNVNAINEGLSSDLLKSNFEKTYNSTVGVCEPDEAPPTRQRESGEYIVDTVRFPILKDS